MSKELIHYITCPYCETEVQYTDQNIEFSELVHINKDTLLPIFEYEEYIECPECGERIIVDCGKGIKL